MSYLVGIDVGGTFTDCAIADRAGKLLITKVPSTPRTSPRMMDARRAGAQALGLRLADFSREIDFLSHGATVGGRDPHHARLARLRRARHPQGGAFLDTSKPVPIVPKRLIRAGSERVDCFGEVGVSLVEDETERIRIGTSLARPVSPRALHISS